MYTLHWCNQGPLSTISPIQCHKHAFINQAFYSTTTPFNHSLCCFNTHAVFAVKVNNFIPLPCSCVLHHAFHLSVSYVLSSASHLPPFTASLYLQPTSSIILLSIPDFRLEIPPCGPCPRLIPPRSARILPLTSSPGSPHAYFFVLPFHRSPHS